MKSLDSEFAGAAPALSPVLPGIAADAKIGYINKMGDHPWFVAEVAGAKAAAEAGGAEFVSRTCSSTPTSPSRRSTP